MMFAFFRSRIQDFIGKLGCDLGNEFMAQDFVFS